MATFVFIVVFLYCSYLCAMGFLISDFLSGSLYFIIAAVALGALIMEVKKSKKKEEENKNIQANNVKQMQQSKETIQLKELKELLDSGIITQEEFEAKKKKILDI